MLFRSSSDDLHHAIDAAAGVLAASILDSARERDARDAFKFALHKLTGRFASFGREDVLTVNRLILERLGDRLTDRLRASGRSPMRSLTWWTTKLSRRYV